ncbi:MAG TPA: methyltransferase domain-containing protein [Nitrososphaerales archaeon]|nr:methyltransferase domain-containing protein [Nitrososphaerales archaeon]
MANTLRSPGEEAKAKSADAAAAPRNTGGGLGYSYRYPRNIVSWFFLARRHAYVRSILRNSMNLDLGCGPHKITTGSVGADLRSEKRPDVVCSVLDLPFADGSFESCTMLEVIEHMDMEKQRRALGEVNRVLEDRGQFIISTPNLISGLFRIVWWFWERTYGREWLHEHVGMISTEEVQEVLRSLGFEVVTNRRIAVFDRVLGAEKRPA